MRACDCGRLTLLPATHLVHEMRRERPDGDAIRQAKWPGGFSPGPA